MPKTKISEFSLTPANNTDIDGIDIAEGCAPSGINNAIRELMSQLKDFQGGTSGDLLAITAGGTGVSTSTGSVSLVFNTSPTLVTPLLGTPTSGTLSNCTVDGTDNVGFRNVPVNSQSAAYTLVLADAGKVIFHPASDDNARTFTIPAASSVAYPIGTAVTFINLAATASTIAITTDTMYLSSAGTTGSRTLAQYGSATAIKVSGLSSSGVWIISGSGLT
jgi:hypothetical protein